MSVLVPILKQGLWQRPHVPEEVPEELQGHLSQEDYQQVAGRWGVVFGHGKQLVDSIGLC